MAKMSENEYRRIKAAVTRRLHKSINGSVMWEEYAANLAEMLTPWLYKHGHVRFGAQRLSLVGTDSLFPELTEGVVLMMQEEASEHGQQAGKIARKTLRGIARRSMTVEDVLAKVGEFRVLRESYQRHQTQEPFAEGWEHAVGTDGIVARRLTCEAEMERVGQAMRNCLANPMFRHGYAERARENAGFVALYKGDAPVVLIHHDPQNRIREVKGPDNAQAWQYREEVIDLIRVRRLKCGDNDDARDLAICDRLVRAAGNGTRVRIGDDSTVFEAGPGFVALIQGAERVLFEGARAARHVRMTAGSETSPAAVKAMRTWLRAAARADAGFRQACREALPGVDIWKKRYWNVEQD